MQLPLAVRPRGRSRRRKGHSGHIFLNYGNIATSEEEVVPIGGGYTYTQTVFPEDDVTDWKVPGLASLLRFLDNTFRKKSEDTANRILKKISYSNNEANHNQFTKRIEVKYII